MESDELKRRLGMILATEESPSVDWGAVSAMSAELVVDTGRALPSIAADYLTSVQRRREDKAFGHAQRSVLGRFLDPEARTPRKADRISLAAQVTLRRPGKSNYRVRAFDASPGGCKLEFIERPDLGEFLWVKFESLELLEARVCWTEGFTAGVEFQKTLHPAVFEMVVKRLAAS
jgi:hypothetical protein